MSSPPIAFEHYPNEVLDRDAIIHTMVGDLQRIRHYPAKGFQIEQEIPFDVWSAFRAIGSDGLRQALDQGAVTISVTLPPISTLSFN